ncbi:Hypothetical predicted protein [Octopus vulgaris]|uniref:Uncharacterized protein n=1 Tax=Octopus vulgaris TaxID=6645 RepID=A0AA36B1L6_OCTVU|nr:Hypothetical predicted protein [Octopus vulgaris]
MDFATMDTSHQKQINLQEIGKHNNILRRDEHNMKVSPPQEAMQNRTTATNAIPTNKNHLNRQKRKAVTIASSHSTEYDDETSIQGSGNASANAFPQAALINENVRHQNEGNATINADLQAADKHNRHRLRLHRKATAARATRAAENFIRVMNEA